MKKMLPVLSFLILALAISSCAAIYHGEDSTLFHNKSSQTLEVDTRCEARGFKNFSLKPGKKKSFIGDCSNVISYSPSRGVTKSGSTQLVDPPGTVAGIDYYYIYYVTFYDGESITNDKVRFHVLESITMKTDKPHLRIEEINKAIEIDPKCGECYYRRSRYYYDLGQAMEAGDFGYERFFKIDAHNKIYYADAYERALKDSYTAEELWWDGRDRCRDIRWHIHEALRKYRGKLWD